MSADKRKVSTDALETLGTIIDDTQKRDAIHLAVEPVEAGDILYAGDPITVQSGIATRVPWKEALGIVDPFLTDRVRPGQKFWFVMMPRMVHSLRHVWTHPAFEDEPEIKPVVGSSEGRRPGEEPQDICPPTDNGVLSEKEATKARWAAHGFTSEVLKAAKEKIEASKKWLEDWCDSHETPGYDRVMAVIMGEPMGGDPEYYGSDRIEDDYIFINGSDAHGEIPDEFWDHVEIVTGQRWERERRPTFFTCSC